MKRARGSTFMKYLLGATALSLAVPGVSLAQQQVEEIVVTARKREESLQDVPVAVTSLNGDQLQKQGIRNTQDLGRFVPNLKATGHPSSASVVVFSIRGQKSGDILSTVDQAVGVYADGVYVPRPRGMNGAFFDLQRVEVLKGPQGTLYGRNTTGGAINLISKNADYNGIHGYVGIDGGNHSLVAPRAAVNVPIIADKLAIRLGYQGTFRKGFGKSVVSGQRVGQDRDQNFARATIVADPWENVNIVTKGEYYRARENGNLFTIRGLTPGALAPVAAAVQQGTLTPLGIGRLFGTPALCGGPTPCPTAADVAAVTGATNAILAQNVGFDRTFYEAPQHDFFTGYYFSNTVTFDLSDTTQFKSITGYRKFTSNQLFDLDGTNFRILEVGVGRFADGPEVQAAPGLPPTAFQTDPGPEQRDRFFSQEFNLSGTALDERLRWLGGVYYSQEIGSDTQHAQALPPLVTANGLPSSFIHDGAKIFNGSWSLYTQEEFKVTDKLTIQLGGRYTEERKYLDSVSRNFIAANNTITCITGVPGTFPATNKGACFTHNEKTFSGQSWLAGLSYKANDDVMFYAKIARGFRGGAFQLRSPTLAPANPETATETEVGFKSEWLDKRVRLNAAAFRTKYANKQESIIVTTSSGGSATVIQNAANAKLSGFEGELSANLVEGLSLRATVSYLKGHYTSFPKALPVNGGAAVDASGERFSDPPWSYSLGARYEHAAGPGVVGLQADWSWTDGARPPARLANPGIPAALLDKFVSPCTGGACANGRASVGLLSASAEYRMEDKGLTLGVFATNLLNKRYQVTGNDPSNLGGIITGITAEPRMWGVTLKKTFGEE